MKKNCSTIVKIENQHNVNILSNNSFKNIKTTDIKKGLNGLAFNSISSLAMSNQMIIKIIKYL